MPSRHFYMLFRHMQTVQTEHARYTALAFNNPQALCGNTEGGSSGTKKVNLNNESDLLEIVTAMNS